jgi:PhnB protein
MPQMRRVPQGYNTIQPYLMFVNAAEAIAFYAKVFGATEKVCMKSPEGRVMHAEIEIGSSVLMMADENPGIDAFAAPYYGGSPVSVMIYVDDCDTTYKSAVDAGASSLREPMETEWPASSIHSATSGGSRTALPLKTSTPGRMQNDSRRFPLTRS